MKTPWNTSSIYRGIILVQNNFDTDFTANDSVTLNQAHFYALSISQIILGELRVYHRNCSLWICFPPEKEY